MKRKYKKALQDCFEPPAPQRKAQFLQQIQAEQSQDTATPLFFQRYPKWIRQSAMVFCAAAENHNNSLDRAGNNDCDFTINDIICGRNNTDNSYYR